MKICLTFVGIVYCYVIDLTLGGGYVPIFIVSPRFRKYMITKKSGYKLKNKNSRDVEDVVLGRLGLDGR